MKTKTEKTKWQVLSDFMKKHWWKAALVIMAAGISMTGFNCEWGKAKFKKDPVKIWKSESTGGGVK